MAGRADWGVASQSLTLPPFAGPNDPQIAIGPDIPADLQAFYTAQGTPVVGAIIYRTNSVLYTFEAIVSGGVGTATGTSRNGVVAELSTLSTLTGVQSRLQYGTLTAALIELGGSGVTGNEMNVDAQSAEVNIVDLGGVKRAVATANETVRGTSGTGTTTSATYALMPGSPGLVIAKQYPAATTSLLCIVSQTLFMTGAVADTLIGVRINGVDTDVAQFFFSQVGIRHQASGSVKVAGVPAGSQTVALVWRRPSGAGTVNVGTGFDAFALTVMEVAV